LTRVIIDDERVSLVKAKLSLEEKCSSTRDLICRGTS
jgi:hypothetical protein